MSLDVEKYKKIAAEATKKAYELCEETEGWNQVSTNVLQQSFQIRGKE